jgi:hypothetical protein
MHAPLFSHIPSFEECSSVLLPCLQNARKIPSNPAEVWKPAAAARWKLELERLSAMFDDAMHSPTQLGLFNCLFSFLCAPGAVLSPFFNNKDKPASLATKDFTVNSALRRILRGQDRRALKDMVSNGVAPINAKTIAAVRKLHPQRDAPLNLPPLSCEQLQLEEKEVRDKLFGEASDQNLSKDVYGWAAWLFFPWRGEPTGFFSSLVRFICFLSNHCEFFPPVCAVLLGAGALTPLHKLSKEEQAQREEAGLEPKIRPINSGCMITKAVLSSVLQTPEAKCAAAKAQPHQLSLGVPRGIERLIHTCRAAHANKWIVGRNDFENGFNSLSRQKMLDAHSLAFPEAAKIFNFLYGVGVHA